MTEKASLEIDTPLAAVGWSSPTMMEVHIKEDVTLNVEGIALVMQVRQELGEKGRHRALVIFPQELDFDIPAITTNHHERVPQPNTVAVAWVVHSERNDRFLKMYLAYWAPPFPAKTFLEEAEARAWLEEFEILEDPSKG